jgi:hypothetical protein
MSVGEPSHKLGEGAFWTGGCKFASLPTMSAPKVPE